MLLRTGHVAEGTTSLEKLHRVDVGEICNHKIENASACRDLPRSDAGSRDGPSRECKRLASVYCLQAASILQSLAESPTCVVETGELRASAAFRELCHLHPPAHCKETETAQLDTTPTACRTDSTVLCEGLLTELSSQSPAPRRLPPQP